MTTQIVNTRIRTLYTTAAVLAEQNPVLLEGEPATESDTLLQKIGDGETAYNDLPYLAADGVGAVSSVNGQTGTVALDAADVGAATAAQGALADSAVQPAALSGYVQSTDSRLNDSREWSADTVSQAEAEAGTSTTRRAFTAQRVFQAIAAWWGSSAAAAKLAGIAPGATANATDAQLRDRSTHTGTQAAGTITGLATVATSGAYGDLSGLPTPFDPASPGAIGGTSAAAGSFTSLVASTRLGLPSSAPASPAAGDIYRTADTLRYRDSSGAERRLLNATDNLANLASMATARTNLGLGTFATANAETPPAIGGTTPAAGSFTSLTLTGRLIHSLNGAASAPPLTLTGTWFSGGTATTTKPQVLIEPAGTTSTAWSTSGTGLGVNAASGFAGKLIDVQLNGVSQFAVDASSATGVTCARLQASNRIDATNTIIVGSGVILSSTTIALGSGGTADTIFARDAANIFAQRNGTNAQTFRVYNTFTSATNNERGKLEWASNVFRVGTEKGSGGGTARAMELQTDGATRLTLAADGSSITAASGTALIADHRLTGTAPASATATGTAGDIRYDSGFVYICTATNTWRRAALSAW